MTLAGGLLALPLAAGAQQPAKVYRVGILATYPVGLARPGGNTTGVSFLSSAVSAKLLDVLKRGAPQNVTRRGPLEFRKSDEGVRLRRDTAGGAGAPGDCVLNREVKATSDLETAFTAITRARPDALLILGDQVLSPMIRPRIAEFAMTHHIPSIAGNSNYAAAGGLIGYGPTGLEIYRRAAGLVAKVLKGAKPADLPVEQPTKLELVINLKTAKALGLTIPPSLLQRADRVIE